VEVLHVTWRSDHTAWQDQELQAEDSVLNHQLTALFISFGHYGYITEDVETSDLGITWQKRPWRILT
jgi:hypothetical protein